LCQDLNLGGQHHSCEKLDLKYRLNRVIKNKRYLKILTYYAYIQAIRKYLIDIWSKHEPLTIGNSCHIVFNRAGVRSNASEIEEGLIKLWTMLKNLEKGIVNDLKGVNKRHLRPRNLTALIGYGAKIFLISDVKKQKPLDLPDKAVFKLPSFDGAGPIIQDS
jgi:hypothetical protein